MNPTAPTQNQKAGFSFKRGGEGSKRKGAPMRFPAVSYSLNPPVLHAVLLHPGRHWNAPVGLLPSCLWTQQGLYSPLRSSDGQSLPTRRRPRFGDPELCRLASQTTPGPWLLFQPCTTQPWRPLRSWRRAPRSLLASLGLHSPARANPTRRLDVSRLTWTQRSPVHYMHLE